MGNAGDEASTWRDALWNDAMETASGDSYAWTTGTEWGAEWMLKRLDASAIVDAHNTVPALMTAVEKVLALHQQVPNSTSALYPNPLCTCGQNYPCLTVRTIEGAINE